MYEEYSMYPFLSGPLDILTASETIDPTIAADPFYNQLRVQTEIDAVREAILRTGFDSRCNLTGANNPYNSFVQTFIRRIGGLTYYRGYVGCPQVDGWTYPKSLVDFVDSSTSEYTPSEQDALYANAYTTVCTKYGGVVYTDILPTSQWSAVPRTRFQCTWPNRKACMTASNTWFQAHTSEQTPVGNYAEWFSFGSLNSYVSSFKDLPQQTQRLVQVPTTTVTVSLTLQSVSSDKKTATFTMSPATPSLGLNMVPSATILGMTDAWIKQIGRAHD